MKFSYPEVLRDESVEEDYHGTKVPDPYRWLEDPDSDQTVAFVEAQNNITVPFLKGCEYRDAIKSESTRSNISAILGKPANVASWIPEASLIYGTIRGTDAPKDMDRDILRLLIVVFRIKDNLKEEPRVFLDPNLLSDDGTISLSTTSFSEDGEYFAYGLSESGSDWIKIKFKKVATGEDLPEVLDKCKFTAISWTHDHKGVFYSRYIITDGKSDGTETSANENQKLCYHRLGTSQSEDILCVEFPDHPKWRVGAELTECGRYVIVTVREGCKNNLLYFSDLGSVSDGVKGRLPLVPIVETFDSEYVYVTSENSVITVRSNTGAPNYCLFNIDLTKPEPSNWSTLIAENPKDVLESADCVRGNLLVVRYNKDVKNVLSIHSLDDGRWLSDLPLDPGTVVGYSGKKKDSEIFYHFSSFLSPGIIYRCDVSSEPFVPVIHKEIKVPGFDPSQFSVEQVFYPSKDGTKVPMYILQPKSLALDGTTPCMLYGYGGFNISIMPMFGVTMIVLLRHLGVITAIANLRGGGEYGDTWHDAGRLFNKQNVFDDFQHAAKYLIERKYTSPKRLIINGASNGGLLVGACINQMPELFGCAIADVGVMDMLRFHKFTIGHAWISDYGCSDDEKHFKNLLRYSPLHNVRSSDVTQYPATLLMTADHDDRVVPLHSFKFISTLQHVLGKLTNQENPLMIRIDTKAGHGAGKPTAKIIEEETDMLSFMARCVGLQYIE